MRHQIRWTSEKITKRLALIEARVYRKRQEMLPFRYRYLTDPLDPPPVALEVDDTDWQVIQPHKYWANPRTDFILRTKFNTGEFAVATAIGLRAATSMTTVRGRLVSLPSETLSCAT